MKKSSSNRSKSNTSSRKSRSSSLIPSSIRKGKFTMPVAGASLAGLAAVGAVGYILWRNRTAILSLLESSGILPERFKSHEIDIDESDYDTERSLSSRNRMDGADPRVSSAV